MSKCRLNYLKEIIQLEEVPSSYLNFFPNIKKAILQMNINYSTEAKFSSFSKFQQAYKIS